MPATTNLMRMQAYHHEINALTARSKANGADAAVFAARIRVLREAADFFRDRACDSVVTTVTAAEELRLAVL